MTEMKGNNRLYVVTGGAGFIGSHIVDALIARGDRVRVLDNFSTGKREHLNPKAELIEADVRDPEAIRPAFANVEGVFHLAALPSVRQSVEHPAESHAVNLTGTLSVILATRSSGARRIVYASSAAVYGEPQRLPIDETHPTVPQNPYGLQKLMSEHYLRLAHLHWGLETVGLRFFNVYGPRMSPTSDYAGVIAIFLGQRQRGEPLTVVGDGSQTRDFIYVDDVVRASLAAMDRSTVGTAHAINIGSGQRTSVHQLARLIGGPTAPAEPRTEIRDSQADIRLARRLLRWQPTIDLRPGLTDLMANDGAQPLPAQRVDAAANNRYNQSPGRP